MLNDNLLDEVATDLLTKVTHFGITETTYVPDPTDTTLTGELAGRTSMASSKSGTTVTFLGVRSSADVIDTTNGDNWKGIGFFNAITSGDMESSLATAGLLQTTNFDVEVQLKITPTRV